MHKGNGKWISLGIFLGTLVLLGGGVFFLLSHYKVKTVYVEGNLHYTQEEIQNMVMSGPLGDNSLYLSLRYKNKSVTDIPFVDVMDVSILAADTIKISVYEKALAGYVKYLDAYMYFDKDGYVVESSGIKTAGIPQITGLSFDHVIMGEQLPVENGEVFERIMRITRLFSKYSITADKIYFASDGEITIYFSHVKAALGKGDNLEDKIMLLPQLLSRLTDKKGTLRMENYSEDNSNITFEPD